MADSQSNNAIVAVVAVIAIVIVLVLVMQVMSRANTNNQGTTGGINVSLGTTNGSTRGTDGY